MIDWVNEDPRFRTNEELKTILAKSPLTKAFLSPNRDSRIWLAEIQKTIPTVENQIDLNFASGANYALSIIAETLGLFHPIKSYDKKCRSSFIASYGKRVGQNKRP